MKKIFSYILILCCSIAAKAQDFDAILSAMAPAAGFSDVATAMTARGALDFVSNALEERPSLSSLQAARWDQNPFSSLSEEIYLLPPVPGRLTSPFGWREAFGRMHHGIDLALQIGDTIRAARSGRVSLIANDADGYGNYLCLQHSGEIETRYGHLLRPIVSLGAYVRAGDPIALGGNTGNSTGPHLHFEVRQQGTPLNPLPLIAYQSGFRSNDWGNSSLSGKSWQPGDNHAPLANRGMLAAQRRTYVVRTGDTLATIATKTGLSEQRLIQLNMLSAAVPLQPGRMLRLR